MKVNKKYGAAALCLFALLVGYFSSVDQASEASRLLHRRLFMREDPRTVERKPKTKHKLEFVHITKTGGSAIEAAAAKEGVMWGACHYKHIKWLGCDENPDWEMPHHIDRNDLRYSGEPWHSPPRWLEPNGMEGSDTFMVVRNPYTRLVSEYYCAAFGYKGENAADPSVFNEWLGQALNTISTQSLTGHMLPMHYYASDESANQVVTHILYYENLQIEFNILMKQYGLPMRLPQKSSSEVVFHVGKEKGKEFVKDVSAKDISPVNIQRINEIYSRDFELFGYPTINTTAII